MSDLQRVKAANPGWFSLSNKRLFGDKRYSTRRGRVSGRLYLVRQTQAWTDMFGQSPRLHYRINSLDQLTLKIGSLIPGELDSSAAVADWLHRN